jgi:hypothetical protein
MVQSLPAPSNTFLNEYMILCKERISTMLGGGQFHPYGSLVPPENMAHRK